MSQMKTLVVEQGLRPTTGIFVIIDGQQGHGDSLMIAALKIACFTNLFSAGQTP